MSFIKVYTYNSLISGILVTRYVLYVTCIYKYKRFTCVSFPKDISYQKMTLSGYFEFVSIDYSS